MKIVNPSHEILLPDSPYRHIERIGRVCYKSEDKATIASAEPFCQRMFNNKHYAMIEHFRFIIEVNKDIYTDLLFSNKYNKYLTFTNDDGKYIISASARGFNDMFNAVMDAEVYTDEDQDIIEFIISDIIHIVRNIIEVYRCPYLFNNIINECISNYNDNKPKVRIIKDFNELNDNEYKKHAWYSVHFVCDRGVTHEMVRHRDASFAQESTRYCNYSKDKFGNEITVIKPCFWEEDSNEYLYWKSAMKIAESDYFYLLELGATPQEARSVLPNSLKTEIVITAPVYEWIHIFNLRVLGTTGTPHPQMKEVMKPVYDEMLNKKYIR